MNKMVMQITIFLKIWIILKPIYSTKEVYYI